MNPPDPLEFSPRTNAWNRLTAEAREARDARAECRSEDAPYGFATRVVAEWRNVRDRERRLALWQRVSWRAALASLGLCAAVALVSQGSADERPLLEPPALAFPSL